MNEADSEKLAAGLGKLGWEEAARPQESDLAVVNTCVVRQKAEDRATGYLGYLRKIKERREGMQIAVMGCMVGPRTEDLRARFPYVDVWARPQSFETILRHLLPDSDLGGEFWPDTFPEPRGPAAFVPVVHGCNKFCTYCIVPYRRGRERSRPVEDVAREVAALCERGVREVTLLGQTVEAYGKDLPPGDDGQRPGLADLFEAIHDTPGLERIRFLTSYPRDMTDRIIRAVADWPKVCEHFNLPLQAGDNGVLARMRRGYTVEEYLECVSRIREAVPEASLSTDVIVGFCGETEGEFLRTVDVLEQVRFDKVHVAAYSPRPGTIAWRHMEDTVPQDEKMRRLHATEAMQEGIAAEINRRSVGTVQEVLVEGEKDAVFTGRNRANKLVHFRAASPSGGGNGHAAWSRAAPRLGGLAQVRIIRSTAWSLQGEVTDVTPVQRVRPRERVPAALPARHVAVLVVIFTVDEGGLRVLLIRRSAPPFKDAWSLPGGLLNHAESLDDAAVRKLDEETGVTDVFLEQLYTFSDLDGRGTAAVAYFALVDIRRTHLAPRREWPPAWFPVGDLPPLAFRNETVIDYALRRLRAKLDYSNVAYSLLPAEFSLSQLQRTYEAILGRPLDKRNFRKRILSLGIIEPTGRRESEGRHRPAQLYRFRERRPVVF
jgi:tRNA-2-methylthio-N6-dimethylallyladenosine synthase